MAREPGEVTRRNAPRRAVLEVAKAGYYGSTSWYHYLECGHTVARKRKTEAGNKIACEPCGASRAERELARAEADHRELLLEARLAKLLGLPVDEVEVVFDPQTGRPAWAQVWLPAGFVERLVGR